MHSILATLFVHALLLSDAVAAIENLNGYKVAKKVPRFALDKRQDGIFGQIDSLIGGLDGSNSPFSGPGTGVVGTPSSSTTTTPYVPTSPISSVSSTSATTTPSITLHSSSSTTTTPSSSQTTSSSVKPVTHTSPLVTSVTEAYTTVYTTVSGSRTFTATEETQKVVPSTTGFVTSTSTPSLSSDSSSGSSTSGLTSSSKKVIGGVVGGIGGALILAGIAFVLWRLYGRDRHAPEDEGLMSERDYSYMSQRTPTGTANSAGYSANSAGMDRTANVNVNPAANF